MKNYFEIPEVKVVMIPDVITNENDSSDIFIEGD